MEYIRAESNMADVIYTILHTTIRSVYPKYYPQEVADFFCRLHSKEHILEGIASGNMGVLIDGGAAVGTGCFDGNHITGVYVLPFHQKRAAGRISWIAWKPRSRRNMIRLFWRPPCRAFACMSAAATKQWDTGCVCWNRM